MADQATQLRNLVLRFSREAAADRVPPPRLLAIGGGKSGVGVTTVAIHLAVALSGQGARVVLVDADLYRADVAARCGLYDRRCNVADVLAARCDIHEVLVPGPGGVQVAPGTGVASISTDYSQSGQERLLRQLLTLGRHADIVVLDTGNTSNEVVRRFWQAADEILVVTTPEPGAVMDSYAAIKRLTATGGEFSVRLIVNRSTGGDAAADVHRRIDHSCQRFLGLRIGLLGHVPPHAKFETITTTDSWGIDSFPPDAGASFLDALVTQLMDETGTTTRDSKCAGQPLANAQNQEDSAQHRHEVSPIVK